MTRLHSAQGLVSTMRAWTRVCPAHQREQCTWASQLAADWSLRLRNTPPHWGQTFVGRGMVFLFCVVCGKWPAPGVEPGPAAWEQAATW